MNLSNSGHFSLDFTFSLRPSIVALLAIACGEVRNCGNGHEKEY